MIVIPDGISRLLEQSSSSEPAVSTSSVIAFALALNSRSVPTEKSAKNVRTLQPVNWLSSGSVPQQERLAKTPLFKNLCDNQALLQVSVLCPKPAQQNVATPDGTGTVNVDVPDALSQVCGNSVRVVITRDNLTAILDAASIAVLEKLWTSFDEGSDAGV